MLYSGITDKFRKERTGLSKELQGRAALYWTEWQQITSKENRAAKSDTALATEFSAFSRKIGLKPLVGRDDIYRMALDPWNRALGKKFEDNSGKQRIVWFWVGTHNEYDKLTSSGYRRSLDKTAENAVAEHRRNHDSWKQRRARRVRIDPAQLPHLQAKHGAAPQRPQAVAKAPAKRLG